MKENNEKFICLNGALAVEISMPPPFRPIENPRTRQGFHANHQCDPGFIRIKGREWGQSRMVIKKKDQDSTRPRQKLT